MKGKSVLLLVIALVCGAIASVGLTQMLNRPGGGGEKVPMMKVFVTMKGIDINEELSSDNIKLEEWPKDRVPEGAIAKLEQVEGKFAMHRLFKGEPVLRKKISNRRIGNEEKIPQGYRAVAVRTSAQSAVSNLLLPGTRVDVIVFLKGGNGIPRTQTRTILKDVRIFSVNSLTTRESGDGKSSDHIAAKTVTLLVEPKQVQLLMLANQLGTIQFAMRKPDDTSDDSTEPTTTSELIGDNDQYGTPRERDGSPAPESVADAGPSDFGEFLAQVTAPPTLAQPVSTKPVGEMVIIDANSPPRKYQWVEGDNLPREVSFGGAPAGAPTVIPGFTPPSAPGIPAPSTEEGAGESSSGEDENAEVGEREV